MARQPISEVSSSFTHTWRNSACGRGYYLHDTQQTQLVYLVNRHFKLSDNNEQKEKKNVMQTNTGNVTAIVTAAEVWYLEISRHLTFFWMPHIQILATMLAIVPYSVVLLSSSS